MIAIVVSGLVGGLLAFSFSRRLRRLRQASAAVAAGDLSQRVPSRGGDEIEALGAQFNTMAAQLAEQMAQLRDLATLEERNRLARELHDAVKQEIFALSLSAATFDNCKPATQPKPVHDWLNSKSRPVPSTRKWMT